MFLASCPCCGCSAQTTNSIYEEIWSRPMSVTLDVTGYPLRQGVFMYGSFAGIAGAQRLGIDNINPYSQSQIRDIAKAGLVARNGLAHRTEGPISKTFSLSADMSQYYITNFGIRNTPVFKYVDDETAIEVQFFLFPGGVAGTNDRFRDTNCFSRVSILVRRYMLLAQLTGDAYAAFLDSAGIQFIDSFGTFTFSQQSRHFRSAVAYVNGPDVFAPSRSLQPIPTDTTRFNSALPSSVSEHAIQRNADGLMAALEWQKDPTSNVMFFKNSVSPNISDNDGHINLSLSPYTGTANRRELYDITPAPEIAEMDRLYKPTNPAFTANPFWGDQSQMQDITWTADPQQLFFLSYYSRSFTTTATVVIE